MQIDSPMAIESAGHFIFQQANNTYSFLGCALCHQSLLILNSQIFAGLHVAKFGAHLPLKLA